MSDVKISQLSAAQPLSGAEFVPIVQKSVSNRNTLTSFKTNINKISDYLQRNIIPVGTVWPYAVYVDGVIRKVPVGWLLCNGSSVLVARYKELYTVIGNTYGDNASRGINFTLPNLRAKIPLGHCTTATAYAPTFGNFQGQSIILGQQGGEFNHTLSIREMPKHTHDLTLDYSATTTPNTTLLTQPGPASGGVEQEQSGQPDGAYSSKHNVTIKDVIVAASADAAGGGQYHTNMPPYLVMNYIIKY